MARSLGKADSFEHVAGTLAGIALAAQLQRQRHVVQRGEVAQQLEVLEHEADLLAAQRGAGVLVQSRQFLVGQPQAPGAGHIQARQQGQQRGLAAAGRADDGAALTVRNRHIDGL